MLLGDLIARFSDESAAEEVLLSLGDLALLTAAREAAEAEGESLGAFMAAAAQRYAAEASDEEWVTLLGAMGRTPDPGSVYLKRALAYAQRPRGECGHAHRA